MKLKKLLYTGVLSAVMAFSACRPGGAEYIDELDLVMTNYSKEANFSNKKTYARPDSIVEISSADETLKKEYINQATANTIISRLDKNMAENGWQKVATNANPDVYVQISAMQTTTIYYYYSSWYWGYPYYGGWYYPGYYPPYASTTTTGSALFQMADVKDTTADGRLPIIWTGVINGMLNGSSSSFASRCNKSVDQLFKQSPSLKLN